jgi:hypothetical protein
MITYEKLREKFEDKGYLAEFYFFVPSQLFFVFNPLHLGTEEEQVIDYKKAIQSVYGDDWEYWNTYIDHQNYR